MSADPAPILDIETFRMNCPFSLPDKFDEVHTEKGAKRAREVLEAEYDEFLVSRKRVDDMLRAQLEKSGSTYKMVEQIKMMGGVPVVWLGKVRDWIEEEKRAMMASTKKFKDFHKLRNPLIKLLERNKEPEPTVQGGGIEEEEEEEEMVIRRRRKGKMIVEEDEEEETPGADTVVYVDEMNTHVPVSLLPFRFDDEPRSQE